MTARPLQAAPGVRGHAAGHELRRHELYVNRPQLASDASRLLTHTPDEADFPAAGNSTPERLVRPIHDENKDPARGHALVVSTGCYVIGRAHHGSEARQNAPCHTPPVPGSGAGCPPRAAESGPLRGSRRPAFRLRPGETGPSHLHYTSGCSHRRPPCRRICASFAWFRESRLAKD
jgi:hypothetical protein